MGLYVPAEEIDGNEKVVSVATALSMGGSPVAIAGCDEIGVVAKAGSISPVPFNVREEHEVRLRTYATANTCRRELCCACRR